MNRRPKSRNIVILRLRETINSINKYRSRFDILYCVAILLSIFAIVLWIGFRVNTSQLLPNIITDLLGVALTVFIIDTLSRQRSDKELKRVLIKQLGSKNNAVSSQALMEIEARGWLMDGSLRKAFLLSANLDNNSLDRADLQRAIMDGASLRNTTWLAADCENAFMEGADLFGAEFTFPGLGVHLAEANLKKVSLSFAKLQESKISEVQLAQVRSLWKATMPDGNQYDGRYNLSDDIELHTKSAINISDPSEWALFYGVTESQYLLGQQWANEHLSVIIDRK